MTVTPSFDDVFAVMAAASLGDTSARVTLPQAPNLSDPAIRFAIALNVLLDDLAFRVREREKLGERLRQVQKMEAIGNLAGGIAHDFNNMLSVILGFTELVLNDLAPEAPCRNELEEVKRAGERARDLTRQLLAFSRRQVLKPALLDLRAVVFEMEGMLRHLLGSGIELSILACPGVGMVMADRSQLEQVIMNLVVNARDAMPLVGGKLAIEVADATFEAADAARPLDVAPGRYVMLVVTDNGEGMEPDVRERVFEPFFTTKGLTQGTGLGLATVFGIVQQSDGYISVESERGHGTAFKAYFPRHGGTAEAAVPTQPVAFVARGAETILVVDDEPPVRRLVRTLLRRNGYNVLEASNAGEALLIFEQHPGKIHLLLTDVVMPHMSGPQLVERLGHQRPEMQVLYMSGYSDSFLVLKTDVAFLQKPVTSDVLLRKVREVLDSACTR